MTRTVFIGELVYNLGFGQRAQRFEAFPGARGESRFRPIVFGVADRVVSDVPMKRSVGGIALVVVYALYVDQTGRAFGDFAGVDLPMIRRHIGLLS